MKALTVQQPWAWAIMHGGKTVENRRTYWRYRGPLAIHAGARMSERGLNLMPGLILDTFGPPEHGKPYPDYGERDLPLGAVLGTVDLVDAHFCDGPAGNRYAEAPCCPVWGEYEWRESETGLRSTIVHYVLANPRPLPEPIPWRGSQGLWNFPGGQVAL